MEQVLSHDLVTRLLSLAIVQVIVADEFPVVAIISKAIVAEPRNFLSLAQRRLVVRVRVQVLPSLVVLEAQLVAALDRRTRVARCACALSIPNDPERACIINLALLCCNDLLA